MTKVAHPSGLESLELEIAQLLVRWIPSLVHRLNNSLLLIHGAAEDPEGREPAERELARVRALLRQLALLARTPEPREEDFDLAPLVEGIAELARPSFEVARVSLAIERPPGAVPVRSDPSRLGKLLAVLVDGLLRPSAGDGDAGPRGRAQLALAAEGARSVVALSREDAPAPPPDAQHWARALGAVLEVLPDARGRAWRLVLPCPHAHG
jgi:hypothetical protein